MAKDLGKKVLWGDFVDHFRWKVNYSIAATGGELVGEAEFRNHTRTCDFHGSVIICSP